MAFTEDTGHGGSDDAPYFIIKLKNNMTANVTLQQLEGRNDMERNFGDLWIIPINECRFMLDCVKFDDVASFSLQASGPDGWTIDSIIVLAQIGGIEGNNYALKSLDMHVRQEIDSDSVTTSNTLGLTPF